MLRRHGYTIGLISLALITADANAACCKQPSPSLLSGGLHGFYVGAFGGRSDAAHPRVKQTGVALFPDTAGGPLFVDARGKMKGATIGFWGLHLGYQWSGWGLGNSCRPWCLTPGVEVEGFFFNKTRHAEVFNPTTRLPEHDFLNTFPAHNQVYLVNAVFNLKAPCFDLLTPYVGVGIGVMNTYIHNANSLQIAPLEVGVNHFNSRRNASKGAFAVQGKVGLNLNIWNNFSIFGEYRALHVDNTRFMFGSTRYPDHAATTNWRVKFNETTYNMWSLGLNYKFC